MLFETFMKPCVKMVKTMVSDGEGGQVETWTNGAGFDAAIVYDNSSEADIAYKANEQPKYTVTTQTDITFTYYDVFKRLTDGAIFRVLSGAENIQTPDVATFNFKQFKAEEWRLPND